MKKLILLLIVIGLVGTASAATVWNPAANTVTPGSQAWGDVDNWTNGIPTALEKGVFNVPGAADAIVSGSFSDIQLVQGDGGPGGILNIVSGGNLDLKHSGWSSVGWTHTAVMNVQVGGTVTFNQAWIGFNPGSNGTVNVYGTMNVLNMFGLGWSGGDGYVNVGDGALLALANIHPTDSIKQNSVLDIIGTGVTTVVGDHAWKFNDYYIPNGYVTGDGIVGNAIATFADGVTTVVVPEPATMILLGLGGMLIRRKK